MPVANTLTVSTIDPEWMFCPPPSRGSPVALRVVLEGKVTCLFHPSRACSVWSCHIEHVSIDRYTDSNTKYLLNITSLAISSRDRVMILGLFLGRWTEQSVVLLFDLRILDFSNLVEISATTIILASLAGLMRLNQRGTCRGHRFWVKMCVCLKKEEKKY